jgi:hypothetical protein
MYLLNVTTKVTDEKVAPFKSAHKEWVLEGIDKGYFISKDPYVIEKLADYEVIDFTIKLATKEFEKLLQ